MQTEAHGRSPRLQFVHTTPAVLRFQNGSRIRGKLQVISVTGGLLSLSKLFVAALAGQHLIRLVIDGRHAIGEERLLLEQHQRIRDVIQEPDGGGLGSD